MAIYRFKISFEDYDDVSREIDIRSNQTFEDLHHAIHRTTGYNSEQSSSFFVCNDQWIKAEEIAYLPTQRKVEQRVALMSNSKLSGFIDDPHQKFYYTYNFDRPYDFHVELIKILDEEKGKEYPFIAKTIGEAPKPLGFVPIPPVEDLDSENFDFLHEADYEAETTEEMEVVEDLGLEVTDEEEHKDAEEDESDEFLDEFSDNENYESDDYSNKEDY